MHHSELVGSREEPTYDLESLSKIFKVEAALSLKRSNISFIPLLVQQTELNGLSLVPLQSSVCVPPESCPTSHGGKSNLIHMSGGALNGWPAQPIRDEEGGNSPFMRMIRLRAVLAYWQNAQQAGEVSFPHPDHNGCRLYLRGAKHAVEEVKNSPYSLLFRPLIEQVGEPWLNSIALTAKSQRPVLVLQPIPGARAGWAQIPPWVASFHPWTTSFESQGRHAVTLRTLLRNWTSESDAWLAKNIKVIDAAYKSE